MGAYHTFAYFLVFLPLVMLVYSLVPEQKRWTVLLGASVLYFLFFSKVLILWLVLTVCIAWFAGRKLGKKAPAGVDRKVFRKQKKQILKTSVLLCLFELVLLKYLNFILGNVLGSSFTPLHIAVPIGVSYYTLQAVSYLCDVSNKKIKPAKNIFQLALYLSFFPTILEGPITRYSDMEPTLFAGKPITAESLTRGYERILWGLYKKVVIADYLNAQVNFLFKTTQIHGLSVFVTAVLCTWQIYMDFSGTIDIVIGSAEIFQIPLAENFRQPFFAKNAGDFWRRWHITLGTFFRDYIFYPFSLSKAGQKITVGLKKKGHPLLSRYATPMIALLLVWLANGVWHGPRWTYIGYGLYYFVLMFLEQILEKPFAHFLEKTHQSEKSWGIRIFRFIKLVLIVITGEMFFRADDFSKAMVMFTSVFTDFNVAGSIQTLGNYGVGVSYLGKAVLFSLPVLYVSIQNEKGVDLRTRFETKNPAIRWIILYAMIFIVIIFGAYGPGFGTVEMMYAGF